jgi:5'-methylthioinosine phosphorylase
MSKLGFIGSFHLLHMPHFEVVRREAVSTPYGDPSAPLVHGLLRGREVVLLARNGEDGCIAPHKINYRANIWALKNAELTSVISLSLATGIRADMTPGHLVVPDQLIDYTYNRPHTFFDDDLEAATHIDFRLPYSAKMRRLLCEAADELEFDCSCQATLGVTQGPRLQTLAEINRLERDGCDLVGMSGMPETILARELQLHFAACALIASKAAGRNAGMQVPPDQIGETLKSSVERMHAMLATVTSQMR